MSTTTEEMGGHTRVVSTHWTGCRKDHGLLRSSDDTTPTRDGPQDERRDVDPDSDRTSLPTTRDSVLG